MVVIIWGHSVRYEIEKVHLKLCKKILCLRTSATNAAVLGEVGRFPLYIHYNVICVKYWLKLLYMTDDRLPKICNNMLYSLDNVNRNNWVTNAQGRGDSMYACIWIYIYKRRRGVTPRSSQTLTAIASTRLNSTKDAKTNYSKPPFCPQGFSAHAWHIVTLTSVI